MIHRNALLFSCWALIYGQPLPAPVGIDIGTITDQARRFVDIYGIATQLMNFGSLIINNAKNAYDSTRHDSFGFGLSENSISADSSSGPRFRDNKSTRKDQDSSQSSSSLPESTDGLFGNSFGSLQTTGKNGIETLLNTFLGPSFFGRTTLPPATNLANFFNPEYYQSENYLSTGASNIDRLINTLKRSGARRMSPDLNSSPNLLQTIFGKR